MEGANIFPPRVPPRMFRQDLFDRSLVGAGSAASYSTPKSDTALSPVLIRFSKQSPLPVGGGVLAPSSSSRDGRTVDSSNDGNQCYSSPLGNNSSSDVLSPIVGSGVRPLQRRLRCSSGQQELMDSLKLMEPLKPVLLATPTRSDVALHSPPSLCNSTTRQGAGGGRRIFQRVGMSCVYDVYGDASTSMEDGSGTITETLENIAFPVKHDNDVPYVRPWLRHRVSRSIHSLSEATSLSALMDEEQHHTGNARTPKTVRGKIQKADFNGVHRRRRSCRCQNGINMGDLNVTELPHTDSSHYIRSYPLVATTQSTNAIYSQGDSSEKSLKVQSTSQNTGGERGRKEKRRGSTDIISTSGKLKSSATLSRTLSDLRARSSRSGSEDPSLSLLASPKNITAMKNQQNMPPHRSPRHPQTRDGSIIQKKWSARLSDSSSSVSNKSLNGVEDALGDADSCCSCCSCFVVPICDENGVINGVRSEDSSSNSKGDGNVLGVAYNNFFDDADIPVLSMKSFRRTSNLSSKVLSQLMQ